MYFSTMMWLTQVGQFQLRPDGSDSLRATLAPVIAHTLLRKGEQHKLWASIDSVIGSFAGSGPATLSMSQVADIVADAGASPQRTDSTPLSGDFIKEQDPAWAEPDIDWDVVRECHAKAEALREALASDATLGIPTYLGSIHADTEHPPRPWHLFSRRFAIDAWAASQVVYEGVPARGVGANKTSRRLPSSMDVAFAVLGNSVGVSQLVDHMRAEPHATSPVRSQLRDGFPYVVCGCANCMVCVPHAHVYDMGVVLLPAMRHSYTWRDKLSMHTFRTTHVAVAACTMDGWLRFVSFQRHHHTRSQCFIQLPGATVRLVHSSQVGRRYAGCVKRARALPIIPTCTPRVLHRSSAAIQVCTCSSLTPPLW